MWVRALGACNASRTAVHAAHVPGDGWPASGRLAAGLTEVGSATGLGAPSAARLDLWWWLHRFETEVHAEGHACMGGGRSRSGAGCTIDLRDPKRSGPVGS